MSYTHTHHKTAQQSKGATIDSQDRKTVDGGSSKPAFDVNQETKVLLALPVSLQQPLRSSEVKAMHAWNTMMSPVVQRQPWRCSCETSGLGSD